MKTSSYKQRFYEEFVTDITKRNSKRKDTQ